MSTPPRSNNFAARMGRWSAGHRRIAIFGWLAFVIVAFYIGSAVGLKTLEEADTIPAESGRAERILADEFEQPASEGVLIQSERLEADNPAFRATIQDVVENVSSLPFATNVRSPLEEENRSLISGDGRSALVQFDLRGDPDDAADKYDAIKAAEARAQRAHGQFFIGSIGAASIDEEVNGKFEKDLERAGMLSIPVTLIILVLTFGALVAAGIPLLLALTAVMATIGLLALPSQLLPVDEQINAIVLLIGLAVGVDYSLFYLKREREERARGRDPKTAVETAAATSGRAVLISGLTVMIAMAGMFFTGDKVFSSFALAAMMVVAIAVLGSLTVLPAVLSKLGDNVERLRVPFVGRRRRDREGRIWGWVLERVLRRPLVSALVAGGALVALALPTLDLRTVVPGAESLPPDLPVVQTYNRSQKAFPGEVEPAIVVVKADNVRSRAVTEAIGQLQWRALVTEKMREPITVRISPAGAVAQVEIPVEGEATGTAAADALKSLRDEIIPVTVAAAPGVEDVAVTGTTAQSIDFNKSMKSSVLWVFGFVLAFAFLLLLVAFRSIVIAVKAIVLNLLSVAAAYGLLVLVFQYGWGKELLGFEYTGGVMAFLPVFLFVILFGLSMDYHVFILSRVREAFDRGMTTEEAVSHGIKTTAGVVTSAASVMVVVFAIFATLSVVVFKQIGVGLAAAILIDATIVRAVLLPATMKLLGDWNWYLPSWLEWLPHLEHAEERRPARPALTT